MKLKTSNLPPEVFQHLKDRVYSREISQRDLEALQFWLETDPDVSEGDWYKDMGNFYVCGRGELVETFLTRKQVPFGDQIF